MKMKNLFWLACAVTVLGLVLKAGVVVGESSPPEKPRGISIGPVSTLDLGPELEDLDGRKLRVRIITFEPGAAVPLHSHNGRPGVAHILKGTLTEHLEGKGVIERKQGDRMLEDKHTVHWVENRSGETAMVFATDVYKP